jgi:hypothetical protein
MDILYVDKCRYEIQEQKEVRLWYAGIYRTHFEHWYYENITKAILKK